jgi:hypothetical protein
MTRWFGAVHAFGADGPAAHTDHVLMSIMDGLAVDFVCTHVLLVEPAAGDVLRPVEIEQPHQCCGGH